MCPLLFIVCVFECVPCCLLFVCLSVSLVVVCCLLRGTLQAHIELSGADDDDEHRDGSDYCTEEDEGYNQPKHVREPEAVVTAVATQLENTGKGKGHVIIT